MRQRVYRRLVHFSVHTYSGDIKTYDFVYNLTKMKYSMKTLLWAFGPVLPPSFPPAEGGQFKSVSVDDFSTLIANPEVQLLDVRTVAEYSEGHVPHSINITVLDESFETMADSTLQKGQTRLQYIVVVETQ